MMRYYRIEIEDDLGGPGGAWGRSVTIMYEIDEDGWTARQIEIYRKGRVLFYDTGHSVDEYGELAGQQRGHDRYLAPFEIPPREFERAWRDLKPFNRREVRNV
jgi:hypothetical protein